MILDSNEVVNFVRESNKIEGIKREPTDREVEEFIRFMELKKVDTDELKRFVRAYQPTAKIRDQPGLDIKTSTGAPTGGTHIVLRLDSLLTSNNCPFRAHIIYQRLQPFTDCNGRSGRALWAWQTKDLKVGFLHLFYYQALDRSD